MEPVLVYIYPNSGMLIQICSLFAFKSWHAHSDLETIPVHITEPVLVDISKFRHADSELQPYSHSDVWSRCL